MRGFPFPKRFLLLLIPLFLFPMFFIVPSDLQQEKELTFHLHVLNVAGEYKKFKNITIYIDGVLAYQDQVPHLTGHEYWYDTVRLTEGEHDMRMCCSEDRVVKEVEFEVRADEE